VKKHDFHKELCLQVTALEVTHNKDVAAIRAEMELRFQNKTEKELQAGIEIEKRLISLNGEAERLKLMIPRTEHDMVYERLEEKLYALSLLVEEKSKGKVTWPVAMVVTLLVGICSILTGVVLGHFLK
jgi:hypothetical protein